MGIGARGVLRRPTTALVGGTALAAAAVTLVVVTAPFVRFAYRAPAVHVMLETVNAVVALLVMYLMYGRFRQDGRLQELLLTLALGTVAVANLVLTALPDALLWGGAGEVSPWAPLVVRLLGTSLLAAAAFTPASTWVSPRSAGVLATTAVLVLVCLGAAGVAWGHLLPRAIDPSVVVGDGSRPSLVAHPAVLGAQALGVVLYGAAALAFARQADRTGDDLVRWVAAGCVLASFARVHYLLFPSLYSDFVYTGDVLRLGFYVLMLVGAAREITSYQRARAQTAVLEDRRRLARDLHDGLIQELSYIQAQSMRLTANPADGRTVERIGQASGRAVDEARRALAALTRPDDSDLPVALQRAVDEMASRYDVRVVAAIDRRAEGDGPMSEALLRITGEAVRNAVRHGGATRIHVRLDAEPLALVVSDDGRGFTVDPPDGGRHGGFGLTSMRERAAGVGADLSIRSEPGRGTTVQVSWV